MRCAVLRQPRFRSEGGSASRSRLTESLRAVLDDVDEPVGRTYRFLRETRMTAVVCELVGRDDVDATAMLTARCRTMTEALVEGLRRGRRRAAGRPQPDGSGAQRGALAHRAVDALEVLEVREVDLRPARDGRPS